MCLHRPRRGAVIAGIERDFTDSAEDSDRFRSI